MPSLGAGMLCAGLTACSAATPSDDVVLKHVLAINTCYARTHVKQSVSGLRACFVARAWRQRLNDRLREHPAILALGRSCEKYVDLASDDAIAAYGKCIRDGMPAALEAPH